AHVALAVASTPEPMRTSLGGLRLAPRRRLRSTAAPSTDRCSRRLPRRLAPPRLRPWARSPAAEPLVKRLASRGRHPQRRFPMLTLVPDTTITSQSTQPTPISSPDTERALADEAAARAAGFSLRPPVYVLGTAVNTTGVRNFRQSGRAFEAVPFASEACGDLAHRVEGERRLDVLVDAPSLRMEPNGRLTSELGSLPISERALDGIARLVTPG